MARHKEHYRVHLALEDSISAYFIPSFALDEEA